MKTELREDMLNISVLGLERPVSVSMLVQPGARGLGAARYTETPLGVGTRGSLLWEGQDLSLP